MARRRTNCPRVWYLVLKLRNLILFNLVAVLGLEGCRNSKIEIARILADVVGHRRVFLHPAGIGRDGVASRFPKEGGHYLLDETRIEQGHGFLCGWCYWVNNVLYYPNLLISAAVVGLFLFGKSGSSISDSSSCVC